MEATSHAAAAPPSKVLASAPPSLRFAAESFVDERSSAWLYRELALFARSKEERERLEEFARFEDGHAEAWGSVLDKRGVERPPAKTLLTHRWWLFLTHMLSISAVLPLIHRHELEAVGKYLHQEKLETDPEIKAVLASILPDEVTHEVEILESIQSSGQHPGGLRSIVLGANDGLGSILALVAGVAGAVASSGSTIVIIAGVAGLVAGAISMMLSNYISVKSERESRDARVEIQRVGIERAPTTKRDQLKHLLEARGFAAEEATSVADRMAKEPEQLLKAIVREGYGLGEASFERPFRLAVYTGLAFLIAGAIPVIPFFFLPPGPGLVAALVFSAVALFMAGVLKSLVTLGPMLKSGSEMLAIGLASAAATFALGTLIGQYGL